MRIIEPNVEQILDFEGSENFYKSTARAARICYASNKKTGDVELCRQLIKLKHHSPFAHSVIYLDANKVRFNDNNKIEEIIYTLCINNPFAVDFCSNGDLLELYGINGRVILESIIKYKELNNDETDIIELIDRFFKYINQFEVEAKLFKSFIIDTSIGCSRELIRHEFHFYKCEQSTRFCNFTKDKFENSVSFNKPYWYDDGGIIRQNRWMKAMKAAEKSYIEDLTVEPIGITDESRGMLPLDTHTRVICTATNDEWMHIKNLRFDGVTGKPHGDIKLILGIIKELL